MSKKNRYDCSKKYFKDLTYPVLAYTKVCTHGNHALLWLQRISLERLSIGCHFTTKRSNFDSVDGYGVASKISNKL